MSIFYKSNSYFSDADIEMALCEKLALLFNISKALFHIWFQEMKLCVMLCSDVILSL